MQASVTYLLAHLWPFAFWVISNTLQHQYGDQHGLIFSLPHGLKQRNSADWHTSWYIGQGKAGGFCFHGTAGHKAEMTHCQLLLDPPEHDSLWLPLAQVNKSLLSKYSTCLIARPREICNISLKTWQENVRTIERISGRLCTHLQWSHCIYAPVSIIRTASRPQSTIKPLTDLERDEAHCGPEVTGLNWYWFPDKIYAASLLLSFACFYFSLQWIMSCLTWWNLN